MAPIPIPSSYDPNNPFAQLNIDPSLPIPRLGTGLPPAIAAAAAGTPAIARDLPGPGIAAPPAISGGRIPRIAASQPADITGAPAIARPSPDDMRGQLRAITSVNPEAPVSSIGSPTFDRLGNLRPARVAPGEPIPSSLMSAAGRAAYDEMRPQTTATPGSLEWNQQRQAQIEFDKAHPWGAPISRMPGIAGKILHGLAVAGNIAGDIVDPNAMAIVPGTQLHRAIEEHGLQAETDKQKQLGIEQEEADARLAGGKGTILPTPQGYVSIDPETHAVTPLMLNGQPLMPAAKEGVTAAEQTFRDLLTGANGQPRVNPDTNKPYTSVEALERVTGTKLGTAEQQAMSAYKSAHPGSTDFDAYQAVHQAGAKADDFTNWYNKWLRENGLPDTAANEARGREMWNAAGQPPQRPPQELAVTPEGRVVNLRPGESVPPGTQKASEYGKVSPDEQRRADLAENLNENLDHLEDIVDRRPELFGPLAGRWTELKGKFGSDDPDIGELQTIEHQIGMAQISAHGMRAARGIDGAAASILNGFHSGPNALKSSIAAARRSVATFQGDVERARAGQPRGATTGAGAPSQFAVTDPRGATHYFRSQQDADAFIINFVDYNIVKPREAGIMRAAVSDKILYRIPQPGRDAMRADILKNMLTVLAV